MRRSWVPLTILSTMWQTLLRRYPLEYKTQVSSAYGEFFVATNKRYVKDIPNVPPHVFYNEWR